MRLKKEHNAVILAHLYQLPDVQDIADFVGDSLDLSRKAKDVRADVIVFCGVRFMAETAKIICPDRIVLLPAAEAGCPMADMVTSGDVERLREKHPDAAVVCYVNSSAEVKAVSDICCTSSNAVKVVESLKEEEIIFVPDRNLGHYVSQLLPRKHFVLFDGFCPTHNKVTLQNVEEVFASLPDVPLLVHPECVSQVIECADFIGSTGQIIEYVLKSKSEEFIIGTEIGIFHRLQQLCPYKKFYRLHDDMICPGMKSTALINIYDSLLKLQYRVELDKQISRNALIGLERMLSVKN